MWTLEDTPGSPAMASHTTVLPTHTPHRTYSSLAALDRTRVLVGDSAGGLWRVDVEAGSIEWQLGPSVDSALDGAVRSVGFFFIFFLYSSLNSVTRSVEESAASDP